MRSIVSCESLVTPRFVLYVGFKCNLRCQFCYYLKSLEEGTAKNESYPSLAKKIRRARKMGKTEIDFTGGEATIHPDFPKLLELCKELGFETINVITNGWKIADLGPLKKFVASGLNEVLFSLHSYDAATHDQLTQIPRSHSRILQAIANAHELGVRVRINSVVNPINYKTLQQHLTFLETLKPRSVNLIVFNPSEETAGYRQEWDPVLHWAFRKSWLFATLAAVGGFFLSWIKENHVHYGKKSLLPILRIFPILQGKLLFRHPKGCKSCSLRLICPGLPKEYVSQQPNAQVHPYEAKDVPLVLNPVGFGYKTLKNSPLPKSRTRSRSFVSSSQSQLPQQLCFGWLISNSIRSKSTLTLTSIS